MIGPTYYELKRIGSGLLAVMAKPVAGEWIDDGFSGLAMAGFSQVVSLLEEQEAFEVGLGDEAGLCARHNLGFVSYPIEDRGLPATVPGFAELAGRLYNDVSSGLSTVVHCRAGIGRTGLVAAGILLHAALGVDEAFELISTCRGVDVPDTDEQRDWLRTNAPAIVGQTNNAPPASG